MLLLDKFLGKDIKKLWEDISFKKAVASMARSKVLKYDALDVTSAATTIVLSTHTNFVVTGVYFVPTITGLTSHATVNVGNVGPNYNDYNTVAPDATNGQFYYIPPFYSAGGTLISSSNPLRIKVTTPAVATSYVVDIYITGFYI